MIDFKRLYSENIIKAAIFLMAAFGCTSLHLGRMQEERNKVKNPPINA